MKVKDKSSGVYNVTTVTYIAWEETTITCNNRPPLGGIVSTFTPSLIVAAIESDVTSLVLSNLDQLITLAVDSTSSDGYDFYSKENLLGKVCLVLEFQ